MAVSVYSEQELFDLAVAYLRARFGVAAFDEGSYFGQLARALAQLLGSVQASVSAADHDAVPGKTVDLDGNPIARNTAAALDAWAWILGLPSNRGAGIYGRNAAQAARGGAGTIFGPAATLIPAGSILTDPTGQVSVQLDVAVTLPGGGSISGSFSALTTGAAGNLPVGTPIRWQSPPPGVQPVVTLTTALRDGYETESDLQLCDRIIRWLQSPPKGGAAADWRSWAEAATDSTGASLSIVRAYVYPHRNGLGSVDVVVLVAGTGAGRAPSAGKLASALAYLKARKIVTDSVRVIAPAFDATTRFTTEVRIVPHPHYEYDWIGTSLTVVSYAFPSLILVGASAPAELKAAIDAGRQPRLQFALPSVSRLPIEQRVTAYADNTPMAGQFTLTLAAALPASPSGSDLVYPGGPAVQPLAAAILSYIDQIGPSRQSGYADPLDVWEDRVSVSGVAQVVRNQRGADGNALVVFAPDAGVGIGIRFAINGGAPTGADVLLLDFGPTTGPQCPDCTSVIVRRA